MKTRRTLLPRSERPAHAHRLLGVSAGCGLLGWPPSRRPERFASRTSAHLAYPILRWNPYTDTSCQYPSCVDIRVATATAAVPPDRPARGGR